MSPTKPRTCRRRRRRSSPAVPILQATVRIREEVGNALHKLSRRLTALWSSGEEEGQGLAEYALILGLSAIVAILSLIFLGDTLADLMSHIGNTIDENTLNG